MNAATPAKLRAADACRRKNPFIAYGFYWLAPILLLILAAIEPRIISSRNLVNLVTQTSYMAVFSSAQMLVILIRGFDLSLGAAVSLVSVLSALTMTSGLTGNVALLVLAGICAGLLTGALIGMFNGFCTAHLRVNPFIVTLGSQGIALGIASMASAGRPVFDLPEAFSTVLYSGSFSGLSVPVWIAIALCLLLHLLLAHTVFGRALYLIGSNPVAAQVAGLAVKRTVFLTYLLAGVVVASGALLLTARTGSGEPNLGGNLLLPSIAAAVVGGMRLQGGTGNVSHAIMGALFISILSNGMNLIEIDGYAQEIILGVVILSALCLDRFRRFS